MKANKLNILLIFFLILFTSCTNNTMDQYDIYAQKLADSYNGEIILYGDSLELRSTFPGRYVTELTEETLSSEEKSYHAIVIMDRSGTVKLSDDDLLLIKDYVDREKYDFMYFGTQYFDSFIKLGFTTSFEENERGFLYSGYGNISGVAYGNAWTDDDEKRQNKNHEIVPKMILIRAVQLIELSNEE